MSHRGQLRLEVIPVEQRPSTVGPSGTDADGYHQLPTSKQWGAGAQPVDKSAWQPCHACGRDIPVVCDRAGNSSDEMAISYVCPFCHAAQVNEIRHNDFTCQETCHACGSDLGDGWLCPHCELPRAWTVVGCPLCGWRQAVQAPHLAAMCDLFTLECVRCEQRFVSLCIC